MLDEADRMLDMGFIHDIRRIIAKLPPKRANAALLRHHAAREIRKLADSLLHDPVRVQIAARSLDRRAQSMQSCLLRQRSNKPAPRALSSTISRWSRDRVHPHQAWRRPRSSATLQAGIRAEAIHGNKSQNARQRALANFRSGKHPLLVATDIAAAASTSTGSRTW